MNQIVVVDLKGDSFQRSVGHERKIGVEDKNAVTTPQNRAKRNIVKKAATTICKRALLTIDESKVATQSTVITDNIHTTTKKRTSKFKDPPPSQLRIDSFFKSSSKSYKIETASETEKKLFSVPQGSKITKTSRKVGTVRNTKIKGRKRLFKEGEDYSLTTMTSPTSIPDSISTSRIKNVKLPTSAVATGSSKKNSKRKANPCSLEDLIDLCSDKEESVDVAASAVIKKEYLSCNERNKYVENERFDDSREVPMVSIPLKEASFKNTTEDVKDKVNNRDIISPICSTHILLQTKENIQHDMNIKIEENIVPVRTESTKSLSKHSIVKSERVKILQEPEVVVESLPLENENCNSLQTLPTDKPSTFKSKRVKKNRVCPPYKKVAGTTFAVDAFQYGLISGVTHYFLTHFHADHYQGLTRKFQMPLYVSSITAKLVRELIPMNNKFIHELEVNKSVVINEVEVTAIDANHCPGAVMFVFKLSTGRCILHTGDFRASPDMESEPIFWNNDIDTIYLDTTYIAHKHNFSSQYESIDRAKRIIREFHEKRPRTRILYVCGSYVIGKERFWTSLAHEFNLKVWTEKNRLKALQAMDLEEVRDLLCDDPHKAEMHVISIAKVSYQSLVDYFRPFQKQYDAVLAFRPSGWEKNGKPQLRGEINIVGIEYSEHSSQAELERFVTYLKPREVISTVPVMQGNPCITPKIPDKWYKYVSLKSRQRNFQPSITSFLKMRPRRLSQNATTKRTSNCVTPTRSPDCMPNELTQLSVRAMATCIEVQRDNKCQAPSLTLPHVITLFPDADALEDWMS